MATSAHTRLTPRAGGKSATPISTQVIGQRIAILKAIIHAIAIQWCQAEDANLSEWKTRHQPIIGSRAWNH